MRKATNLKCSWEEFWEQYIETVWFDHEDRAKTVKAMRVFLERVPQRWLDKLPVVLVFAPSQHKHGAVLPWFQPIGLPSDVHGAFIYLSPALEKRPQGKVNSTVAHEFAHAIFRHHGKVDSGDTYRQEREADTLISKWGYRPTNSYGWMQRSKKVRG